MIIELNKIAEILKQCNIYYQEKSKYFIIQCFSGQHEDQNPSMRLYYDSGIAHCFSCGFSIHINQIYKKFIGKDLDLEKFKYDYSKVNTKKVKEKIINNIKIKGDILSIYNNEQAYRYAQKKGLNKDFIEFFNVKSIKLGSMQVDDFKEMKLFNRLIFPIEENHKLISIEARDYTEKSSKKILYPEGSDVSTLFGIDHLDFNKPLFLVEGIKSLWKLWTIEKNSTSKFNNLLREKQKNLLIKFPEIILLPDNDAAGMKLVSDLSILLDEWNKNLYIAIPEKYGDDPNDLTIDELKKLIDNRKLINDWNMDQYGLFKKPEYNW